MKAKRIKTISAVILLTMFTLMARAQTMYALIACDTEDEKIGAGTNEDLQHLETLVDIIATATGLTTKIIFFTPKYGFSKRRLKASEIINVINKIQCTSKDILFFFYSGHGTRKNHDSDPFPTMAMGKGSDYYLKISRVRDMFIAKNPKLSLVMGSMCNQAPQPASMNITQLPKGATSLSSDNQSNYRSLFTQISGNITICSSPKGELSYVYPQGGAFTLAFLAALTEVVEGRSQPASWENLMKETGIREYQSVKRYPYFEINIQEEPFDVPPPIVFNHKDPLINTLLSVANANKTYLNRINMQKNVLEQVFDSPRAKVEIVGRNGTTILARVPSQEYLSRICTIEGLTNLSIKKEEKSASGKYTYLKIHEIFIQ